LKGESRRPSALASVEGFAAVHQQAAPGGRLDEDGIGGTHVEEGQVQASVRQGEDGRPGRKV